MWRPACNKTTECAGKSPSFLDEPAGQRVFFVNTKTSTDSSARICRTRGNACAIAEVDESFLEELIQLRGALRSTKESTEEYVNESNAAAAFGKLTQSLKILQATKLDKQA